ncbi:MAG: DUF1016 N-terminal domain-containing protein [Cyclobacteriaceae bacterium]|nr:DUF1016 N-terminal domain-containing protein [Cyclobacteriaceae bacterium]
MKNNLLNSNFLERAIGLLQSARQQVVQQVNLIMVHTYFEIGKMIIEEEQGGEKRAGYGKGLLKELSNVLTQEFGKGFSVRNIEQMRKFYSVYSISQTVSANSDILIFASKYKTVLPSKKDLKHLIKGVG